ncbi:MAG: CRTAC1 family protein [Gemmataceae bacterium]
MTRRSRWLVAVGLFASLIAACNGRSTVDELPAEAGPVFPVVASGPDFFADVTAKSRVEFRYRNGEEARHMAILESLGGGPALLDFDGDGKLDLFIPGGGYYEGPDAETYLRDMAAWRDRARTDPSAPKPAPPKIHGHPGKLYRNLGNFQFEDVTDQVGLGLQPDFYSHGCAVADYDRDGWPDLLVTGYGRVVLYHNEPDGKGGRKFVDVTAKAGLLGTDKDGLSAEAGQPGPHFWSTSAAWADLDGDGYPELYLCQYVNWSWDNNPLCSGYTTRIPRDVCPPKQYDSRPHTLWKNNGNGTFTDVTKEAGLRTPPRPDRDYGKGLGVLIVDVDGDGKPDIYVCNDTTDNFLFLNRSTPGKLKFEERGLALGVARDHNGVPNGSMGADAADFDGGGRPAVWVTNYENEFNALYRNQIFNGRLAFTFQTPAAGLTALGPNFVGFGTKFVDIDNDGWEDLVISNGHVIHFPPRNNLRQRPIIFMNLEQETQGGAQRRFADGSFRGGDYFQKEHRGRGLAVGDLDNDGRQDLVFVAVNEPVRILRNVAEGNHWLGVELRAKGHADIVGAKLTLEVGDRKLVRFVKGGGSYLSAHDQRVVFGLGSATKAGKLTVEWPSGEPRVQQWDALAIDKYHRLEQVAK